MQYTEKVMEHFMNPNNVGVIENPEDMEKSETHLVEI